MKKKSRIPTAADLIEAVTGFLEQNLLPVLEGNRKFNTRVSINALHIVRRELTQPAQDEILLLDLAEQIRSGKLDENDEDLLAALRRYALIRLSVDNPGYSSYLAARERGK